MGCSLCALVLALILGVSNAVLTPQEYWKAKLPNTPLPPAVQDLLSPDVRVRPEIMANARMGKDLHNKIKYALMNKYIRGIPDEDIFFLETAVRPGRALLVNFTRGFPAVALLSRAEASSWPFSPKHLPDLLRRFSLSPNSAEADSLKLTLESCEGADPTEMVKYCATSLESMVDFVTSSFGTDRVWALSSDVLSGAAIKQEYVISAAPTLKVSDGIACHPAAYPYSVFYCHVTSGTRGYVVSLVGKNGATVKAVVVCHTDTSSWDTANIAFRMLNVERGKIPICHFLGRGSLLWAPRA